MDLEPHRDLVWTYVNIVLIVILNVIVRILKWELNVCLSCKVLDNSDNRNRITGIIMCKVQNYKITRISVVAEKPRDAVYYLEMLPVRKNPQNTIAELSLYKCTHCR